MEKFKGTKWQVVDTYHEYEEDKPQIIIWDGDEQAHKPICDMGEIGDMNYAEELANARLIAASPELLEALQKLMWCYGKDGHLLNYNVDAARQAINKALNG